MGRLKITSWNVNGIRAVHKKGFLDWLEEAQPDILGLQETKISEDQLTKVLTECSGYKSYWSHCKIKKGYSGVAIFSKEEPLSVKDGFGMDPRFDEEGRIIIAEYADFILFNIYFPNGQMNETRLQYKLDFYEAFLQTFNQYRDSGKKLIVCGDFNTAHKPIDLARPKENEKVSGFLPIERAWMDKFVGEGYIDTFREFTPDPHHYTWWNMRSAARERNVGWRIDYFFISPNLAGQMAGAIIHPTVQGSDHCPLSLELNN